MTRELAPDPEPVGGAYLQVDRWQVIDGAARPLGHIIVNEGGGYRVAGRVGVHPTRELAVQDILSRWLVWPLMEEAET